MEFVEEESRPRFLFQARSAASSFVSAAAVNSPADTEASKINKLHAAVCVSGAAALLLLAYLSFSGSQILASLLLWAAFSFALGPFAPSAATGGDARVGRGDPLPDPEPTLSADLDEPKRRIQGRRVRSQKTGDPPPPVSVTKPSAADINRDPILNNGGGSEKRGKLKEHEEEKEWTEEDLELLRKQISKHPVGEPRRWERIAEAFYGRHGLDSVIGTAKSLSERKPASGDSYQQFLKQRKSVDKRVAAAELESQMQGRILMENDVSAKENGGGTVNWSAEEDIALLNALKVFPKDVSMRWEKIAAAVPGKSKASCMKRIAELKKSFRNSKATEE